MIYTFKKKETVYETPWGPNNECCEKALLGSQYSPGQQHIDQSAARFRVELMINPQVPPMGHILN